MCAAGWRCITARTPAWKCGWWTESRLSGSPHHFPFTTIAAPLIRKSSPLIGDQCDAGRRTCYNRLNPRPMALKTLIVDDEPVARKILREELDLLDDVEVIAEADNGAAALERIAEFQ